MGDTGREPTHRSEALAVHQFIFEQAGFGLVFHQNDRAAFSVIRAAQCCLVQVQPTWLAAKIQPVFVTVQIVTPVEVVQQRVPVFRQGQ